MTGSLSRCLPGNGRTGLRRCILSFLVSQLLAHLVLERRLVGLWRYVYRAIDQNGQVIDAYMDSVEPVLNEHPREVR